MFYSSNAQETDNYTAKFQKLEINFIIFSLPDSSFVVILTLQHIVANKTKRSKIILLQIVNRTQKRQFSMVNCLLCIQFSYQLLLSIKCTLPDKKRPNSYNSPSS